ncbi:MAG: hypothetical protein CM1200mP18_16130 [Gammaproteobacteria bacterium]|nr:MAG: hypothetical protein CM1200mP18_16130 [Gammaproteobacteria bacterium]
MDDVVVFDYHAKDFNFYTKIDNVVVDMTRTTFSGKNLKFRSTVIRSRIALLVTAPRQPSPLWMLVCTSPQKGARHQGRFQNPARQQVGWGFWLHIHSRPVGDRPIPGRCLRWFSRGTTRSAGITYNWFESGLRQQLALR